MKTAVIIGNKGQDGTLLSSLLKRLHYKVYGLNKQNIDLASQIKIYDFIKKIKPKEVYYLAAYHHSSETRNKINLNLNYTVNYHGVLLFLEAIKKFSKNTKFFFASSSFVFLPSKKKQNEKTKVQPSCQYSNAKAASMLACDYYKNFENLFVSYGILYNHESIYRNSNFLSKKIISHAIQNSRNSKKKLRLKNLNFKADWGFAPDYVNAMQKILNIKEPKNFIISTGKIHSVKQFVEIAYSFFNLDYKRFVVADEEKNINNYRLGDSSLLRKECNWKPSLTFKQMIESLIKSI